MDVAIFIHTQNISGTWSVLFRQLPTDSCAASIEKKGNSGRKEFAAVGVFTKH